jgi:hypothetical protein
MTENRESEGTKRPERLSPEKIVKISTYGHPCYDQTVHKPKKSDVPISEEYPLKEE